MSQVKERPILFSAPMVRAILEGRKTVTRRAVKIQPHIDASGNFCVGSSNYGQDGYGKPVTKHFVNGCCPYGKPGDRLWVRETWYCDHFEVMRGPYLKPDNLDIGEALDDGTLVYAADGLTPYEQEQPTWKPSIHMPRWACRILLEITDVRVERLQDITYEQAAAEGVHRGPLREWCASDEGGACHKYPVPAFRDLWQSVGGNWDANPWVWVVEFKRVMP
ncbi:MULTISPECIES: hypothetical protein [Pseudomonas]|uniref:hypothetical protein n=1 Tax=Pseudomonas TaxID=286 RepID=UPI00164484D9|nr:MULTISPECIES: hypothetical protein [Pseudomonas]MBK3454968.1 hypothetical protein [Pseudomonas sp. MF6754]QXH91064.1 hypothetical protein HU773_009400 [Pseudomonas shahriarae]